MSELSVMGVMKAIVPITRFNKGEANRIFDEVESGGTKIVMKNNRPACVLMSPGQYESLIEMLSDIRCRRRRNTGWRTTIRKNPCRMRI